MTVETNVVEIAVLGAQGDGIANTPEGPRYVPFALPGERVRPREEGLPELIAAPSAERQEAPCRHFGICGGCVAQHMSDPLYADWKRGTVVEAFRQHGLAPDIAPLVRVPPASRRRAVLTAVVERGEVTLGYHRRRSHALFGLEMCPVLAPEILAALPGLRAIASALRRRELRLTVLSTPAGLDISIEGAPARLDAHTAAMLATLAARHRCARIAIDGESIVAPARPELAFGATAVVPPPGAFVQAAAAAEAAMTDVVLSGLGSKVRRAVDLFSGIGTFTFALAERARVLAIDGDAKALAALSEGARRATGLKPIETKVRDLFRDPLSPKELDAFDAVVLDPPRAGAKAQAQALARSKIGRIAYVSCNPATLARDARILTDAGCRLTRVTPIDQFLWSPHVEAVAVLER